MVEAATHAGLTHQQIHLILIAFVIVFATIGHCCLKYHYKKKEGKKRDLMMADDEIIWQREGRVKYEKSQHIKVESYANRV